MFHVVIGLEMIQFTWHKYFSSRTFKISTDFRFAIYFPPHPSLNYLHYLAIIHCWYCSDSAGWSTMYTIEIIKKKKKYVIDKIHQMKMFCIQIEAILHDFRTDFKIERCYDYAFSTVSVNQRLLLFIL